MAGMESTGHVPRVIGYARVSSVEQETSLQLDALHRAGVQEVVQEKCSAGKVRHKLEGLLARLGPGDLILVYKVDRFARSLSDLLRILDRIEAAGAGFRSLTEPIDTSTPAGRMMMQMLGAFAEFERSMIRERSVAGQIAAVERGAKLGRRRAVSPADEAEIYRRLKSGVCSATSLAREYGCHLSSIKRIRLRRDDPTSPAVAVKFPQAVVS